MIHLVYTLYSGNIRPKFAMSWWVDTKISNFRAHGSRRGYPQVSHRHCI